MLLKHLSVVYLCSLYIVILATKNYKVLILFMNSTLYRLINCIRRGKNILYSSQCVAIQFSVLAHFVIFYSIEGPYNRWENLGFFPIEESPYGSPPWFDAMHYYLRCQVSLLLMSMLFIHSTISISNINFHSVLLFVQTLQTYEQPRYKEPALIL